MERFIVSARKYRPQNFNSVVGQDHITTTLKNAIRNNQLAHAFLFCGPRGVGKTTCARILGKTINCENRTPDGEACNECQSCVSFDRGTSLNIHELDGASNNTVEDIRALVDQVRFAPQAGKYKVYIVDEVHMLTSAAFNAFLKTLEEPPPFAIFILATTEKYRILPTILSRCQIFDFKRISNKDTALHLKEIGEKEHIHTEDAALHVIAQKSEGCLRDALSLFDKIVSFTSGNVTYANTLEHLNVLDEDYFFKILNALITQQLSEALLIYDGIDRKGFEGDAFLDGFAEFLRNLLVSKDVKVASLLEVPEDFKPRYAAQAREVSESWIISAISILSDSIINLKQSRNKRLLIELTLVKLSYLNQAIDFSSDDEIKKKLDRQPKSVSFRTLVKYPVKETVVSASETKIESPAPELHIEKPVVAPAVAVKTESAEQMEKKQHADVARPRSLDDIRKDIAARIVSQGVKELTADELEISWNAFIKKLEAEGHASAVSAFRESEVYPVDNNCVEIICHSDFHQNMIDGERSDLIRHLQSHFNNRMITFSLALQAENTPVDQSKYLNPREKYQQIVKHYPLVATLKDKLKLKLER
ncbi:MAG: DNA polymerase III subunit gamma/tau [Chitinophagaceae bacterium]|nr:DNA polymerase III subunit gamma/tau [Chitinophagaceae bacterium]